MGRKKAGEVTERVARELVPEVTTIHSRDEVEPVPPSAPPRRVRWFVPRGMGQPTAHGYYVAPTGNVDTPAVVSTELGGPSVLRSRCGGVRTEGGIYPPAGDVPKCPACVEGLALDAARLEEERNAD